VYFKHDQTNLNTDANWTSFLKASDAPAGKGAQQVWAKPQPDGAVAVLFINGGGVNGSSFMQHAIKLAAVGLNPVCSTVTLLHSRWEGTIDAVLGGLTTRYPLGRTARSAKHLGEGGRNAVGGECDYI
jgi:hypothetical protein